MRSIAFGFLLATVALGQSELRQEGPYWVETLSGTLSLQAAERLKVSFPGYVTIEGTPGLELSYVVTRKVKTGREADARRLLGENKLQAQVRGRTGILSMDAPSSHRVRSEVRLQVPASLRAVQCETSGGNIMVTGLDGELQAETAGGRVQLDRIKGPTVVKTAGGTVELGEMYGPVRCSSSGGTIQVKRVEGAVEFETAGGDIRVGRAGGLVRAVTAGGNIVVEDAAAGVLANTGGGVIKILKAGGQVRAESGGGAIKVGYARGVECTSGGGAIYLEDVSGALYAHTAVGSIVARLLEGQKILDSQIRTSTGDITVYIPSSLSVTIMARSEAGMGRGRIVSDFPEVQVALEEAEVAAAKARGALNGGGPTLELATSSGSIFLRRR